MVSVATNTRPYPLIYIFQPGNEEINGSLLSLTLQHHHPQQHRSSVPLVVNRTGGAPRGSLTSSLLATPTLMLTTSTVQPKKTDHSSSSASNSSSSSSSNSSSTAIMPQSFDEQVSTTWMPVAIKQEHKAAAEDDAVDDGDEVRVALLEPSKSSTSTTS